MQLKTEEKLEKKSGADLLVEVEDGMADKPLRYSAFTSSASLKEQEASMHKCYSFSGAHEQMWAQGGLSCWQSHISPHSTGSHKS